eukprot:3376773-Pleurochrysis_carterae.AAC.3
MSACPARPLGPFPSACLPAPAPHAPAMQMDTLTEQIKRLFANDRPPPGPHHGDWAEGRGPIVA